MLNYSEWQRKVLLAISIQIPRLQGLKKKKKAQHLQFNGLKKMYLEHER